MPFTDSKLSEEIIKLFVISVEIVTLYKISIKVYYLIVYLNGKILN